MRIINLIYLGVLLVIVLLGADPSRHHMIADGVRDREIVIARRRHIAILDERVVQMPVEAVLHFAHVLHLNDAANTDLLAFVAVGLWLRHDDAAPNNGVCVEVTE